jgi:hypothetical protein
MEPLNTWAEALDLLCQLPNHRRAAILATLALTAIPNIHHYLRPWQIRRINRILGSQIPIPPRHWHIISD